MLLCSHPPQTITADSTLIKPSPFLLAYSSLCLKLQAESCSSSQLYIFPTLAKCSMQNPQWCVTEVIPVLWSRRALVLSGGGWNVVWNQQDARSQHWSMFIVGRKKGRTFGKTILSVFHYRWYLKVPILSKSIFYFFTDKNPSMHILVENKKIYSSNYHSTVLLYRNYTIV